MVFFEFQVSLSLFLIILVTCREESETNLKGILGYTEEDLVSTDFVGDSRYCICQLLHCINSLNIQGSSSFNIFTFAVR